MPCSRIFPLNAAFLVGSIALYAYSFLVMLLVALVLCQGPLLMSWLPLWLSPLLTPWIPYVVGAIDGSHIPIIAPRDNHVDYFNRKGFHSILLQLTVAANCSVWNYDVGWAGSTHELLEQCIESKQGWMSYKFLEGRRSWTHLPTPIKPL